MKLRRWQSQCISAAFKKYNSGQPHFLCLATPGAGKTLMAAELARRLLDAGLIEIVLCFAPSVVVSNDFRKTLEVQTGKRFNGDLGSTGNAITYQGMIYLNEDFWALFDRYRVFVIFDEIHHCAGADIERSNSWGKKIITNIQGKATFTLALSGTPWRTDQLPVSLAQYCADSHQIICDYKYGIKDAIHDGVCRTPRITLIDNDAILVKSETSETLYPSFAELLGESECSYQQLIESEALICYMLKQADSKLEQIREVTPEAGGLIVATSVAHAIRIQEILYKMSGERAVVATYQHPDAPSIIDQFKRGIERWIISVGMISEGTNIPRLHVCCHLSRIKTELHFRQVLGRILRATGRENEQGFLYLPAEPALIGFARNVATDLPHEHVVSFECIDSGDATSFGLVPELDEIRGGSALDVENDGNSTDEILLLPSRGNSELSKAYERMMNLFGRFRAELLAMDGI